MKKFGILSLLASALILGCALWTARNKSKNSSLLGVFPANDLPEDPIITPLMMGYSAEQDAVENLARMAGPLKVYQTPDNIGYGQQSENTPMEAPSPWYQTQLILVPLPTTEAQRPYIPRNLNNYENHQLYPESLRSEHFPSNLPRNMQTLNQASKERPGISSQYMQTLKQAPREKSDITSRHELLKSNQPPVDPVKKELKAIALRERAARVKLAVSNMQAIFAGAQLKTDRTELKHIEQTGRKRMILLRNAARLASRASTELSDSLQGDRRGSDAASAALKVLMQARNAAAAALSAGDRSGLAVVQKAVDSDLSAVRRAEATVRRADAQRAAGRRDAAAAFAAERAANKVKDPSGLRATLAAGPPRAIEGLLSAEGHDAAAQSAAEVRAAAARRELRRALAAARRVRRYEQYVQD